MQVAGREFSEGILDRIRRRVAEVPALTRSVLSREVCEWLGWRGVDGRLKEMSCRTALLKLERDAVIELPPARETPFAAAAAASAAVPAEARQWLTLRVTLPELGRVWLTPVDATQAEQSRLWWDMMRAHHRQGGAPLCGAQQRYLIECEAGVLGGLGFSAAAWRLGPRDEWIGWDEEARAKGLPQVVGNSRFLILPGVRVRYLASHVLSLALRRLGADWRARYGIEPLLVETFVDRSLYRGTSYRAANWILLGSTQGRGRQDRKHSAQTGSKDIWVYPLRSDCKTRLQSAAGVAPTAPCSPLRPAAPPPADWAEQEFGGCNLPDARLQERLLIMARDYYGRPTANLPQACSSRAKTKAAYRFLDHEATTMDTLLQPHYRATQQRIQGQEVVLAVQDTSFLNYTTRTSTQGLGPIGTTVDGPQGLVLHSTLVFNLKGRPLGFVNVQCHARDPAEFGKKAERHKLPIEEKESHKWLKSWKATAAMQAQCPGTLMVNVGDREADLYELFAEAAKHPQGPGLLVRARHDRTLGGDAPSTSCSAKKKGRKTSKQAVADVDLPKAAAAAEPAQTSAQTPPGAPVDAPADASVAAQVEQEQEQEQAQATRQLWSTLQSQAVVALQTVKLPATGKRKARDATLEIRHAQVMLKPPKRLKGPELSVWAVLAQERDAPAGVEPLEWMLLTTVAVNNAQDAVERLRWYTLRWGIEVLHRTLKSGCGIENRQLGQADRLEASLAIDLVVAWRIYHLSKLSREDPDAPCTVYFTDAEWQALKMFETKKPAPPEQVPTMREMTRSVATLGGFLGRKCDGEPGTQTLWLGLQRLDDIVVTWRTMMAWFDATQKTVSSRGMSG
jgi:hypothetical protein